MKYIERIIKICKNCKKEFQVENRRKGMAKFCSHDCYAKSLIDIKKGPRDEKTKIKISIANKGKNNGMYGKKAWNSNTKGLTKSNSGSFKKGQIIWNKGTKGLTKSNSGSFKKGQHISCKTEFKKGQQVWNKGKKYNNFKTRGENNINWKGGITPLRTKIWQNLKSKEWRLSIYERDNFSCQMPNCDRIETFLNVHHITTFSKILNDNKIKTLEQAIECQELWNLENGITLCKKCHNKIKGHEKKYISLFKEIVKLNTK